jgi:molybdate transport system substrate-binding protein
MMKRLTLAGVMIMALSLPLAAEEVSVAVAANFTDATRDIVTLFEKASGHKVKASFGSTGKLYSQIEYGAPFEVFLSADSKHPQLAENTGLAVDGTRFTYAFGKLALWSPKADLFDDAQAYLKAAAFKRIAIANPKTAPYGLAAQQVLERLGLWSTLRPRLVQGDSIAQTFQFVATGNAEVGFVALSQVNAWKTSEGSVWGIPQEYYTPIEQQGVLLDKGRDSVAARAFLAFLKSDAARAVITGYGYGVK